MWNNLIREDCFAYCKKEKKCFALTKLDCKNCKFYKHSDNPEATRKEIVKECEHYTTIKGGIVK